MDHKAVIAVAKALREHDEARPGSGNAVSLALGLVDNTWTRTEWGDMARAMMGRGLGVADIPGLVEKGRKAELSAERAEDAQQKRRHA